jgi:hypothetical protein
MNYILAILLIVFPSLCYSQIGQIDCSKAIDDMICTSFSIQSCSLSTTQQMCPNKCFCSGIDIQLPPTNIARPTEDDRICDAFELSSCQYESIKDMCPNKCSLILSTGSTTQLPTVQDDEICQFFTLSNCILVAIQNSCPNLCSAVIVSASTSTSTTVTTTTTESTSTSTLNTKTTPAPIINCETAQDDSICSGFAQVETTRP